jgi:hypothetical protein
MVDWLAAAALAAGATGAGLLALLPLLPARQPGAWALRLAPPTSSARVFSRACCCCRCNWGCPGAQR